MFIRLISNHRWSSLLQSLFSMQRLKVCGSLTMKKWSAAEQKSLLVFPPLAFILYLLRMFGEFLGGSSCRRDTHLSHTTDLLICICLHLCFICSIFIFIFQLIYGKRNCIFAVVKVDGEQHWNVAGHEMMKDVVSQI